MSTEVIINGQINHVMNGYGDFYASSSNLLQATFLLTSNLFKCSIVVWSVQTLIFLQLVGSLAQDLEQRGLTLFCQILEVLQYFCIL